VAQGKAIPTVLRGISSTRALSYGYRLLALIFACAAPATLLTASTSARPAPSALAAAKRHAPRRVGGRVHPAWPRIHGKVPRTPLARWMARQVGPTQVKPCQRRVGHRLVRCHRAKPPRRGVVLPGASADLGVSARLAGDGAIAGVASVPTGSPTLELVRSYDIPIDDPSYTRLLNWSWTYDSAMTAAAFVVNGYAPEAEQLLDQLAALQHTDGSIEIAFDVATGTTEPVFRSGTIASVGLAGALYDLTAHSSRYLQMEERAAGYLLSLQQTSSGLIRGGPDVTWYSTQHNLLAYSFLQLLATELIADGNHPSANTYSTAANKISSGIESSLLVHNGGTAYFIEGLGDSVQSLDADALGAMYLQGRNETAVAQEVLAYADSQFAVSGRSIVKSNNPAAYNETYAANGPFSGFKPYLGTGAPNVLWTEGSAEMLLTQEILGQPTTALSQSLSAIAALTPGEAPVQADQVAISTAYGEEYHVWPSAAAGAWMLLAEHKPAAFLFSAAG
jgi:hypothetical protein